MKIKMSLIAVFILGFMGIQALAAEQKTNETQTAPAAEAEVLADGQQVSIKGVVEKTGSGLFLLDGKEAFLLKGDNGLASLVGQPVEIQGIFKKGKNNPIILVHQAKVL